MNIKEWNISNKKIKNKIMKKDISKIPKGHYCYSYDAKTDECNHCPYLGFETINTDVKPIKLWHCSYFGMLAKNAVKIFRH